MAIFKEAQSRLAVAIHIHEHGCDGYLFRYDTEMIPETDEVAEQLCIDFDTALVEDLIIAPVVGVPGEKTPVPADLKNIVRVYSKRKAGPYKPDPEPDLESV